MRILKRIVTGIIIFLAIAYVLPVTVLQTPYFQEKISRQTASYLKKKLQTEVHIRQIDFGLFNQLILKDVYLEDESGEVLFQAKRVAVGFEFFPLLKKKWRFDSIQLFTFQLNLNKETNDSPLNIQYIIDAFAKQDTTTTNPEIDLQIRKLNLQMGSFSYQIKSEAETPDKFNPKHLLLSDISSKIHINNFVNNELDIQLSKLSFKEQSGLHLKNGSFDLIANETEAKINQLLIELGKSTLLFTDISANYDLSTSGESMGKVDSFRVTLKESMIFPNELSPFVPVFSNIDDQVSLTCDFMGSGYDLAIKNLHFRYDDQITINADASLRNIFHFNRNLFYVRGNVSHSFFSLEGIERLVNEFSEKPFEFPMQIKQMQDICFEGNVNGSFDDLAAWGVMDTGVGNIQTSLTLGKNDTRFLKGHIASENLNLEKLLNNNDFGDITFDIQLDAKQDVDQKFFGTVDANIAQLVYKGYTYQNLDMNGKFSPKSFEGNLNLNSPEGKISGDGLWIFNGKDSKFDFQAEISDIQLEKLNLTNKYGQALLSFNLDTDLTGNDPDNLRGTVTLSDLLFETDKGSYSLDRFKIASTPTELEKRIHIDSEILSGNIWGNYSFKTIVPALKQTLAHYLPSLITPDSKYFDNGETDVSMHLTVEDMTGFSKIFKLPFSLHGQTDISGRYNDNELNLELTTPHAIIAGSKTDSLKFSFINSEAIAKVDISGTNLQKKGARVKFNIQANANDDILNTSIHWGNGFSNYRGDLNLTSLFSKQESRSPIRIETNIRKTDLVFNDSIWSLDPATITVDSSNIRISNLKAFHQDQFLKIEGAISHNQEEKLQIDLNRMDLEYIFQSLALPALEFGGMATGYVTAQDIFLTRKMETRLDVTDFSFNQANFGYMDLTGTWNDEDQGILMAGTIKKNDTTFVNVDGIIYPVKEELSIDFDAENADASFLRKYLNSVVKNITGSLSGNLRLFGDLNNPTVEGDVFAKDCRFGIEFLNTTYTFTDSVKCLPDSIKINNTQIYDEKGNKAIANGYVQHKLFQNFNFYASVSYADFMLFNATKPLNPMFNGTVYGNGTAALYGTEDLINIDVIAQNTVNSKIVMNFMEEPDVEDFDFIRFVSVKRPIPNPVKEQLTIVSPVTYRDNNNNGETEIRLNLTLNATPQATIDLIMDPVSGDKISANGNGNLQIQYGTKIPLKVSGNYVIEYGKYNFSFQQLFIRNFDIQEGSTIAFRGNPYAPELGIRAHYTVNANLEDLDRQLIENRRSARSNVPVNCILMLTGPMNQPAIAFDLSMPGAPDELVRQVKSHIRTEDMLNRQIGHLLVFSRFYTPPENVRDDDVNANWSYLTATLSTQISNMLGLLSDKFQLGTTFHQSNTGAQTNTEFDLLYSGQLLNNRLIVNGNFGYINNPYINSNVPLVGDFDMEYKLTKSGDIRLKGFNHYNFRNYYSITPEMTQGVGILFRKDFNHWMNLLGK